MRIYLFLLSLVILSNTAMAQQNPKNLDLDWKTDTSKRIVPLEEFTALLMPDGIPPIDKPEFWDIHTASQAFFEHEPVIIIEIAGKAKAYPLSILTYHEIVNDTLGGTPIAVTYCPLCNAAIVFDRRLSHDGKEDLLDFGVSGMLRNSDLVMWDRQTQSWWQQFTGSALVGELVGEELTYLPSLIISLGEFIETYPEGLVLSTNTGHDKKYGTNPYTGYDNLENSQPRLYKGEVDSRLPAMERVVDVQVNGNYKIYPLSVISREKVINDTFGGQSLLILYTSKTVSVLDEKNIAESRKIGSVTVFRPEVNGELLTFKKKGSQFVDEQSGSSWSITGKCIAGMLKGEELLPVVHGNHFAFAWFEFHPDSEIY